MTNPERDVMNFFSESGEYYDRINEIPDDILSARLESVERIISSPDKFPFADHARLEEVWPSLAAVCAGRLIFPAKATQET